MIINGKYMSLADCMVPEAPKPIQPKKSEYIWVAYSKEYPYLPIEIASSSMELAKSVGVQVCSVESEASRLAHGKKERTRYARVLIEE